MRPVRKERTSREERSRKGRQQSRGGARSGAQQASSGKRPKFRDGPLSRAWRRVTGFFSFRRPMFLLTLGLLCLTALAGLFASGWIGRTAHRVDKTTDSLFTDAGFGVRQVHLSGNQRTPAVTIMAALGLTPGQSIFDVDLVATRQRLVQLPWIAEAQVRRRYPDDIIVDVVEKVPFARWQSPSGALYVVERTGGLITDKGAASFTNLPLLAGDAASAAAAPFVDAVSQHRAIVARVAAYQYQSGRRWNLLLDDGVVVKLPETGWRKQLDVLDHLIVDKGVLEDDVKEIDLRSQTHYFFVRKTDAPKDKKSEPGSQI